MSKTTAVLTGDLKGSTKASEKDIAATMDLLSETAAEIARWRNGTPAHFTRFRGDGWQMLVAPQRYALRAALFLIARLRAADHALYSRIAIGIGQVDNIGSLNLADAAGTAFTYSGRSLDTMPGTTCLAIDGAGVTPFHRIIVRLLSERCQRWTREQAAAMALYLHPDNPTLNDLAPRFGISPQAVNYRLKGAAAMDIRLSLREWENADYEANSQPCVEQDSPR